MAGNGDDVIENVVVQVSPDLTGFKRKLLADLKKELAGVEATFKVRLVADKTGFTRTVRSQLASIANRPEYKVKLVADARGFARSVRSALKDVDVDVTARADTRSAGAAVDKVRDTVKRRASAGGPIDLFNLNFDDDEDEADTSAAYLLRLKTKYIQDSLRLDRTAAEKVERDRFRALAEQQRAADLSTRIAERAANDQRRVVERAAREAAIANKARNKTLFTSPRIIDYGGKGVKPMNLLLGSALALTPALFAMGASALQASTSLAVLGSAGIGAALGVGALTVAFQGIGDVLSLRKQVQNEALTAAANTTKAIDETAQARRSLADAIRDEKTANEQIHTSRREAIRDLEDLRQSVIDLNNQYRSDALSVDEAKDNEARTNRNFFATAVEKRRATQDRMDAETKFSDTRLERRQKTDDLKKSLQKGIEGSDKVRDAKERARDARDRTLDATASLKNAQTQAAGGIDKTSSAAARLKARLAELSPAARDLYYFFDRNEKQFKRLRNEIAQKTLPGFTTFLEVITRKPQGGKSVLQLAADYAGDLGAIIGKYAGKFGDFFDSPLFRTSMATVQRNNASAFETLGQAMLTLADPITRILAAVSPGAKSISDEILKLSERFAAFIETADEDGSLAKWFKDARTEAGKWYRIAGNILELLKELFQLSLPAGGSLVSDFEAFTQSLVDAAKSPEGVANIKAVFGFFKDLPYAKIADFIPEAIKLFAAFRFFAFLKGANPILLAIGALGVALPGGATTIMGGIASALDSAAKTLAANPLLASTLLGLLAAGKVSKAIGFNIAIPAVTSLRDALTSKFKVLDKFVGGGANAATMTVQAGVVNVYGKAGIGGAEPAGKPGKGGKARGAAGAAAAGGGLLTAGITVAALVGAVFADQGFKRGIADKSLTAPFKEFIASPSWKTFSDTLLALSPVGLAAFAAGKLQKTTQEQEGKSFQAAINDAARTATKDRKANDPNVVKLPAIKNYLRDRKKSVDALVEQARITEGPAAAAQVLAEETKKSADSLSYLLQTYGYAKPKADSYARAATGLNTILYQQNQDALAASGALDGTGKSADTAGGKAATAAAKMKFLADQLDRLDGTRTITVAINGYDVEVRKLESAVILQQLLRTGEAPTESKIRQYKTKFEQTKGLANGGRVEGYSPHPKADNIPAMLTADEYVQPVAAVKHYGTDFMEAVRTRQFPKYAAGGLVGSTQNWPFKIKMPDVVTPVQQYATTYNTGGGRITGNEQVAEIAEATARQMGATTKQLVALIETGLVESGLRNLSYGDRDSVGFLQQRPSQGWGSVKQIMNVAYATRKFIQSARRKDRAGLSAGDLSQAVQRSGYPDRYAKREADAIAILNRNAPFLAGYAGSQGGGKQTGPNGTRAGLIAFGRWLQARGYDVSEHPAFGGVGRHGTDSQHYRANAIDVNHGAGTSAREQAFLRQIIGEGHRRGFRSIFMSPGHYNHAHFDLGPGHAQGGPVKARKYDTGGVLPPGYTMAFNGTGKNETIRTSEQEKNLQAPMRIDRRDLAQLAALFGGGGTPNVNLDGRKVAELTNRYNYLPAGV
jgi:hypothetical protein